MLYYSLDAISFLPTIIADLSYCDLTLHTILTIVKLHKIPCLFCFSFICNVTGPVDQVSTWPLLAYSNIAFFLLLLHYSVMCIYQVLHTCHVYFIYFVLHLPTVYINSQFWPGNWKQWKWKPEMENGNGKWKQSKFDAKEC